MDYDEVKREIMDVATKHPLYQNIVKTGGKIVISRGETESPEFLFIGEAPGFSENKEGRPFVGRSGKVLDAWMARHKIGKFAVINAVPMIPLDENGKIRKPTNDEIEYFRPYTKKLMEAIRPRFIVCLGKSATQCINAEFKLCGWTGNIGFIYHPSYYLRNGSDGMHDFDRLMEKLPSVGQKGLNDFC